MKRTNKFVAALSIAAISTLISSVAFAADGDMYEKANLKEIKYTSNNLAESTKLQRKVTLNAEEYGYEYNGKIYTFDEVNKTYAANKSDVSATLEALDKSGKEIGTVQGEKVEVKEVKAIAQTIASNKTTELKFLVNGNEKLTAKEFEAKYKGYTVAFKYNVENKDEELGANHVKGEVTTKAGLTEFKYAVQITDAEGNKLPETVVAGDFVDVKVTNATTAVKVTEVQLQKDEKNWSNLTVTDADNVKIAPTVYENDLGQKNTDKDANGAQVAAIVAPTIETATSSAPTIAYYDRNNNVIKVLGTGEVTFTVKFKDIEGTHQVKVNALAEQKVTSIKAETQKVKADTATEKAEFVVLDQSDEAMRTQTDVFYTLTKKGDAEVKDAVNVRTDLEGKASLDVSKEVGEYIVNVYTTADKKVKIGSFVVEAINVKADAKIDEYKIEFADEKITNLDINPSKEVSSLEINVTPYVSGIAVNIPVGVQVKSSDEKVFTANFKAGSDNKVIEIKTPLQDAKPGKANLVLYTKEGDLITELKEFEVEVKNTAPQYETLTLKVNTKVDGNANDLKKAVIAAVKEEVTEDQIASVKPLKDDGVVLVTMADAFGGKTIQLDAEFVEAKLAGATLTPAVAGEVEQEGKNAVAAKAIVDGVTYEAVKEGKSGNGIKVEIKQGLATENNPVQASVSYDNNKLTVILGATWNDSASKPSNLKVSELKTLIDGNENAKAAIKVTADNNDKVIMVADETSLENGEDEVKHKDEVLAKDGKIVLIFSEPVALEENAELKIGDDTFKNTKVSKDGKIVSADVELAKKIKINDKINEIKGIKPVKGKLVITQGEIEVKAAN